MTDYMVKLWATWFSLGKAKKAPGTMGTLGAIPLYLLFNGLRGVIHSERIYNSLYFVFLMGFFVFSVYICNRAERDVYGKKDPQEVVIDEVLGFMTTMFLINPHGFWQTLFAVIFGFAIFRVLDITKPGFIYRSQDMENGVGVVMDDFLAGVVGNLILALIAGALWG